MVKKITGITPKHFTNDGKLIGGKESEYDVELLRDKLGKKQEEINNARDELIEVERKRKEIVVKLIKEKNLDFPIDKSILGFMEENASEEQVKEFKKLLSQYADIDTKLPGIEQERDDIAERMKAASGDVGGYWVIPITDELRARVQHYGLPLLQSAE